MYCQPALKNGLVVTRNGSEKMMDHGLLTDMKLIVEAKEMFLDEMLVLTVVL